jgi:hypothetical protein
MEDTVCRIGTRDKTGGVGSRDKKKVSRSGGTST